MPFVFECPQCGTRRFVGRHTAGRRVRCPACETLIELFTPPEGDVPLRENAVFEWGSDVATMETAEAKIPVVTGKSIAVATPHEMWQPAAAPPTLTPSTPVLPIDDDTESEEKVVIKSQAEQSEMDMTPMVDVTFLLLIFFMVTASFTMQKSLAVPKPQQTTESAAPKSMQDFENDPDYITVRVDEFSTYHIVAAKFDEEVECPGEQELLVKLREARLGDDRGRVPSKMLVIAHGDATHERVVGAIDAGVTVGIEDVQLLSVEDEQG